MGRFDNPPPYKSEKPPVPEWADTFGEVEIRELDGIGGQKLIDLARQSLVEAAVGVNEKAEGEDVKYYTKVLSFCATVGGEAPPMEWLLKVPFPTLKRLGDIALKINGMEDKSEPTPEKK
jgi:hypothetical protein